VGEQPNVTALYIFKPERLTDLNKKVKLLFDSRDWQWQ
jgi:hypothetical protein